jgi:hypothetical protein
LVRSSQPAARKHRVRHGVSYLKSEDKRERLATRVEVERPANGCMLSRRREQWALGMAASTRFSQLRRFVSRYAIGVTGLSPRSVT